MDSKSALVFFLWLKWLLSYKQFCDFLLNNICKKYLGPLLPPDKRIWQLIYLVKSLIVQGLVVVGVLPQFEQISCRESENGVCSKVR